MRVLLVCTLLATIFVKDVHGQALYPTSTGGVGAVYTMTNGGVGNQILVHSLDASGVLTKANNVSTNGTGVNTTANGPLFSQGALIVYSNYLFAVNPGSNSLSMFMISSSDATQLTLLSVQAAYGTFPVSITANDMYVCVLTGGSMTGIRCFTYNSSGLAVQASFDRNLTPYISQTIPPTGPALTMSEILFSADNAALIVSFKGSNSTRTGRLLFYPLSNNRTTLAATPTEVTPTGGIQPSSMTLVGSNGLLITDPGAAGVLTLTYTSANGSIANSTLTPVNTTMANSLSWSTYSSKTGNYYVIGAGGTAPVVELNINITSTTNAVQIVRYYPLSGNTSALDATVVSLAGKDYLYVLGVTASGITGYQLLAAGNATSMTMVVSQMGNTSSMPKLVGLAAFVQTRSATSAAVSLFFSTVTVMMSTVLLVFICE